MTAPLTSLSHGAGCGCKLSAADLRPIVAGLPLPADPRVLVAADTADDAAVVQLTEDLAIVQTADFFTPIVDDPYAFGQIAATNALSDVYAMGGRPVSALNLVAYPLETLGAGVLREILRGGADATAIKKGLATDELVERAVTVMTTLNDRAAEQARAAGAHALTDVTGFGLLGHLHELASASGLAAEVDAAAVPAIALELLEDDRCVAGGSRRNRADAETFTSWDNGVPEVRRRLLADAMTSGGLLAAVTTERAAEIDGALIGRLVAGEPGTIAVV
jgi:selenide,water dikinase